MLFQIFVDVKSLERKAAKDAGKGKGGGGKEGIKERTASAIAITCSLCKLPFQSMKMKVQLKEHWEAKHPRNTFEDCFPGQTPP